MIIAFFPIISAISVEIETLFYAGALLLVSLIIPTVNEAVRDNKPSSNNILFSVLYGITETILIYIAGVWIFLPVAVFIISDGTGTFLINCAITSAFIVGWRRMVDNFGQSKGIYRK